MRKVIIILLFFAIHFSLCVIFACEANAGDAAIKLKMKVANRSETESKIIPVKSYLPKGITPEVVLDKEGFQINYDFEKSLYYVYQEVNLEPKQERILEVSLRDIWNVDESELNFYRGHVAKIVGLLRNTKYYEQAKVLADSIISRIEQISEKEGSREELSIEEKFSVYESKFAVLEDVKKDMGLLEDLVMEFGGGDSFEKIVGEAPASSEPIRVQDLGIEAGKKIPPVKFTIEWVNSSNEEKTIPLKYYLPVEVKPEYIVDKGGFEVGFDYQKGVHYVYRQAVSFAPNEKKEFVVEVKDIWVIPLEQIKLLKTHIQELMSVLQSSENKQTADLLGNKIIAVLDTIADVQSAPYLNVGRHIADYRESLRKFEDAKREVARLERLVILAGGSAGITVSGNYGRHEVLRGAKGMKLVARSIFRGEAPSKTTTWKIIYMILGFLGLSSFFFIMSQFSHRHIVAFDSLSGVYRRDYILEKLKEQVIICGKMKSVCSVILLDIDKFKDINDSYGHIAGDAVIKNFVVNLKSGLRQSDLLGRYGGDEFLIILPFVDKEKAKLIAEKIRKIIEESTILLEGKNVQITSSIGISLFPDEGNTAIKLLSAADKALYKAKKAGGNAVV